MLKQLLLTLLIFVAVIGTASDQRIHSNYKRGLFRSLYGDADSTIIIMDSTKVILVKQDSLCFYDPAVGDTICLYEFALYDSVGNLLADSTASAKAYGIQAAMTLLGNPNYVADGDSVWFSNGYGIDISVTGPSAGSYDISVLIKADTTELATKKTIRDSLDDVTMGEGYIDSDSTRALNVIDKYYAISFENGDANQNITGTNDSTWTIIRDGWYKLSYSISSTFSINNTVLSTAFFINDVEDGETETQRKIATAGDVGNYGGSGITYLEAGDALKLKVAGDKAGTVTISDANANIFKLR